jgi:hypothetical protein
MYSVNLKKKSEQSESTLRNSTRLSRSPLSFSTKSSRPKGSSQASVRLFLKSIKRSDINIDGFVKSLQIAMPVPDQVQDDGSGIQKPLILLDSGFCRNDTRT